VPTVFRWRSCRFYFWSHEGNEPRHVHVDCAENTAKIWLDDLSVARNEGFNGKEMRELVEKVRENRELIREVWDAHLG
jgi:Domain of unknown function (DUF4160)